MSNETKSRLLVAQMLRRQQQKDGTFQFSLRTLLISITFFCFWLGMVCVLTTIRPREIPVSIHYWIAFLWACIIVGAIVSQTAWYYFLGGVIGNMLASPLTLIVFHNDQSEFLPLTTFWWMSFAFATFACLTGGMYCVQQGKLLVGIANIVAFGTSIVAFVATS